MANLPETSFMPQQPLLKVEGSSRRREQVNLALVVALVIFFITLFLAGGVYFYKTKIDKEVHEKGQQLADEERNFDVNDINVFKNLQATLGIAKQLVDSHTIFSVLLDMTETHAAENVGLTAFAYQKSDGGVSLTLAGQAPSYAAVYFQLMEWRQTAHVKKVEVTSLVLDERTGIVTFSVQVDIDSAYLGYSQVLREQSQKSLKTEAGNNISTLGRDLPASSSGFASGTTPTLPIKQK